MILELLFSLLLLFPSIILHEYAHGWVANKLGDPTAKLAGRLSLNPLKHIDPVGTIILPGILLSMRFFGINTFVFGWAKPVPVNFSRLKSPRRDMVLVALAGPITNILIAVLLSIFLHSISIEIIQMACAVGIYVNVFLALFNMMPIPPLDGSRLIMGILPNPLLRIYASLEPYGIAIVALILYLGIDDQILIPIVRYCVNLLGVNL